MTDTQTTTGWPPSALMQDDCKELSKWLAKRACGICWKRKAKGKTMVEAKVLAAMAARWFDAAGFNIAFSCLPSDIAREGASASAGLLAAAVELRDLLAQSPQGRQALRDLGFEPAPQADSVTAPAAGAVAHTISDAQIEAMPVWRNFVGLWPESRREIVDAVVDLLTTPPTQAADSVLEDAARLDWLLLHISGAEFRRIGVHYSGNARRADVDAARKQGANHD